MVLLFAGAGAAMMVVHSRRLILEPLESLAQAVRAVEAGDLGSRAAVLGDDEIGGLAQAFNAMTARVEGLMTDLRESEEKFRL
ncbi:MAG: HAMP domain-containing protein, partial [Rhodospirillaceae bacterium]|nr:HAMP domain-containing protein [Rhodospirillaceae bacterium]